jgi:hypothetical protein
MKHLSIILFLFLVLNVIAKAQNNTPDTISIEKKMLGADFDYKGQNLSLIKLEDVCKPYPDAMEEIMMAKRNSNPSIILTLVGAGLIGYTGIKWLMGDNPQWYFAAGGALMIGATIPLYRGSRNHSINAARIYNYEIKHQQKQKP